MVSRFDGLRWTSGEKTCSAATQYETISSLRGLDDAGGEICV